MPNVPLLAAPVDKRENGVANLENVPVTVPEMRKRANRVILTHAQRGPHGAALTSARQRVAVENKYDIAPATVVELALTASVLPVMLPLATQNHVPTGQPGLPTRHAQKVAVKVRE